MYLDLSAWYIMLVWLSRLRASSGIALMIWESLPVSSRCLPRKDSWKAKMASNSTPNVNWKDSLIILAEEEEVCGSGDTLDSLDTLGTSDGIQMYIYKANRSVCTNAVLYRYIQNKTSKTGCKLNAGQDKIMWSKG